MKPDPMKPPTRPLRLTTGVAAAAALFAFVSVPAHAITASSVDIYEMALYLNASNLNGGISLADYTYTDYAPGGLSDFVTAYSGQFDVSFSSALGAGNYGSVTWNITNNTGVTLQDVRLFGYLNADLGLNFADDFGTTGLTGSADWYQIGLFDATDPVIDSLLFGSLSNGTTLLGPGDVVFGLGFNLGDIAPGAHISAQFFIDGGSGALRQFDDAGGFYFSGSVAAVPAPPAWQMLVAGLLLVGVASARRKAKMQALPQTRYRLAAGCVRVSPHCN